MKTDQAEIITFIVRAVYSHEAFPLKKAAHLWSQYGAEPLETELFIRITCDQLRSAIRKLYTMRTNHCQDFACILANILRHKLRSGERSGNRDSEEREQHPTDVFRIGSIVSECEVMAVKWFGALVKLSEHVEGLLRFRDISWGYICDVTEYFENHPVVDVVILEIDDTLERVQVGIRQLDFARWHDYAERHPTGDLVSATVINTTEKVIELSLADNCPCRMKWSRYDHEGIANPKVLPRQRIDCIVREHVAQEALLELTRLPLLNGEWDAFKSRNIVCGSVIDGMVTHLKNYGAFIAVGDGVEGFLHKSEQAWGRVRKPREIMHVGQKIKCVVTGIDDSRRRISLSVKRLTCDPWQHALEKYPIGSRFRRDIIRIMHYGAFVELELGIDAMIHVSDISDTQQPDKATDVLAVGQTIDFVIINVDKDNKKISASMKPSRLT